MEKLGWIEVAKAAKKYKIKSSRIHSARQAGTIPKWMEKRANRWYVDDTDNGFLLHVKSGIKKATAAETGHKRARRKTAQAEHEINVLEMDETQKLQELSIQAELSKPIVSLRLEQYKIETQKLKLEQQAGDLISRSMSDYLFTSYLDRMNRELLTFQNKLEGEFEKVMSFKLSSIEEGEEIIAADIAKELKSLVVLEAEDIIRNVKRNQIEALKKWAKEVGVRA